MFGLVSFIQLPIDFQFKRLIVKITYSFLDQMNELYSCFTQVSLITQEKPQLTLGSKDERSRSQFWIVYKFVSVLELQ